MKLIKPIHPTAYYTGSTIKNRWRFTYKDRDEQCYTGNYHKSNGFFVFKHEESGSMFMKCMSDRCKNTKHILKRGKNNTNKQNKKRLI